MVLKEYLKKKWLKLPKFGEGLNLHIQEVNKPQRG